MQEAIMSGVVAILVCLINSWVQLAKYRNERQQTIELIEYKLEELAKQVRLHNNLIERVYKLEESSSLQDAELKRVNKRLEVIESQK